MHKLDRIPFAHNWVRNNREGLPEMVKALVRFHDARIPITLGAFRSLVRDRLVLNTCPQTLLHAAQNYGHKNSQKHVHSALEAFLAYDEQYGLTANPCFDEIVEPFRLGRGLKTPVQPTAVVNRNGTLEPLFVFGWASIPLDLFQRRLFMTAIEDAVFSLSDFRHSPGKVIFFPKFEDGTTGATLRRAEVWNRGDYQLLTPEELKHQVESYVLAVEMAKSIIASRKPIASEVHTPSPELPLFDGLTRP